MIEEKEWFSEWFESPYYDLLYSKRDDEEAAYFLDNLLKYKPLKPHSRILDLPCGKGRHSVYLHQKGFSVVGADLSERSILYAKQFETTGLKFLVHDMRDPLPETGFDLGLNLFTSFGYFDEFEENLKVLQSVSTCLNTKGIFVLDYLNPKKTQRELVEREEKQVDDVHFEIHRSVVNGFVIKNITFITEGSSHCFQEKVRLFSLQDFEQLFAHANLKIEKIAGNYTLQPFDEDNSERLILIASKQTY